MVMQGIDGYKDLTEIGVHLGDSFQLFSNVELYTCIDFRNKENKLVCITVFTVGLVCSYSIF